MKTMSHRTTFALDKATAQRLKRLAARWQVSQAEVVRRAVALAEKSERPEKDPVSMLQALHRSGKALVREEAETYLAQAWADRKQWRGEG